MSLFDFFIDDPVGRILLWIDYVLVCVALYIVCGIFDPTRTLYFALVIGIGAVSATITALILSQEGE